MLFIIDQFKASYVSLGKAEQDGKFKSLLQVILLLHHHGNVFPDSLLLLQYNYDLYLSSRKYVKDVRLFVSSE